MQKTSFFWPAALASSQLVWMLCAKYAWPPSSSLLPYFEAALLGGTALSYLLCYLIPAMLGRDIATGRLRIPQWAELLMRAWLLFGAASSICWIFTWAPLWLVVVAAGMLALRQRGPLLLACFGFGVLAVGLVRQWPGLWKLNPSLGSDYQLADDYSLFLGIVLAGVPVSLFAFRIGSDIGQPLRGIATRGLLIHALPVAAAVTLSAFNFVGGVRMFWRPSLPIGPEYGLAWISAAFGLQTLITVWSLLVLAPLCAWLLWARATIGPVKQLTPASIALFAGIIALSWYRSHGIQPSWPDDYDTAWGWTLLALSLLYGCYRVVRDFVTRSAISRN